MCQPRFPIGGASCSPLGRDPENPPPGDAPLVPGPVGRTPGLSGQGQPLQAGVTPKDVGTEPEPDANFPTALLEEGTMALFGTNKDPDPLEVLQGGIFNCPLPALLAALALADKTTLKGMITETVTPVVSRRKGSSDVTSKRYFDVTFAGKFLNNSPNHATVSAQLYFRLGDQPGTKVLVYADSSNSLGWVSYIEKAYVILEGGSKGYEGLNATTGIDPTKVMMQLVGNYDRIDPLSKHMWQNVDENGTAAADQALDDAKTQDTELDRALASMLGRAKTVPVIAGTPQTAPVHSAADQKKFVSLVLTDHHVYTIMDFKAAGKGAPAQVSIREARDDPSKILTLPLFQFKKSFQIVLAKTGGAAPAGGGGT